MPVRYVSCWPAGRSEIEKTYVCIFRCRVLWRHCINHFLPFIADPKASKAGAQGSLPPYPSAYDVLFRYIFFSDKDFMEAFRMSREAFEKLANKVRPFRKKDVSAGMRSRRYTNSVGIRLAVVLLLLAGANHGIL